MRRFIGEIRNGTLRCNPGTGLFEGCRLLWRGYIANRDDILSEARRRGMSTHDGSDGRLFAIAYRCWGEALQSYVLGEFCLAVFDDASSTALLTHDALGLVPLFYGARPEGVIFASHLEDLVAAAGVGDLDEDFIADYVADPSFVSRHTPYMGLKRLDPASSMVFGPQGQREVKGRELSPSRTAGTGGADFGEQFLSLLEKGVKAAAAAPGPVWCELSGGLDSSTVMSMAVRGGGADLGAFSIIYRRYAEANEEEWIRLVLECFPVPWHRLDGDGALPYSEVPDRFCAQPALHMVDWAGRRAYEEMAAAHGVAAVLTGQGGDVVFFGVGSEPYHLADLARALRLRRLFGEMERWRSHDSRRRSRLYWLVNYVMCPLMSRLRGQPVLPAWHRDPSPWIHPEYAGRMGLRERGMERASRGRGTIERSWFMERLSAMCGQVANVNQIPRSFEFRHPLLYRPLVEFMLSLPWDEKFDPGTDRPLQRRALSGILPEPLRLRTTKTVYDQPCYEGLRQGKHFVRLLTEDPLVARRGIVESGPWIEAVAQARMGRTHSLPQFEAVASLEIWLRQIEALRQGHLELEETPLPAL